MPIVGITGGIATGKSTFVEVFLRHFPAGLFDSDKCAHELLETDADVRKAVIEAFGTGVIGSENALDRSKLRERVFSDPAARRELEEILHPRIRSRWVAKAARAVANRAWLCVDIPLLYETGAESHFEHIVVVACSPATQRRRLREARSLSDEMAEAILAAQLDLRVKINKADHVIWNDSTTANLDGQADLLARWLRQHYG